MAASSNSPWPVYSGVSGLKYDAKDPLLTDTTVSYAVSFQTSGDTWFTPLACALTSASKTACSLVALKKKDLSPVTAKALMAAL